MECYCGRILPIFVAFGSLFLGLAAAQAADPEIDRLLRSPIGKDWVTNRGFAMGEGLLFFGQLDANGVAIDMKTGKLAWKTPIEKWENGYGITSAPLYYDGIVYSGITGGEFGVRGRLTALDAKTGAILWRRCTLAGPRQVGGRNLAPGHDPTKPGVAPPLDHPPLAIQLR